MYVEVRERQLLRRLEGVVFGEAINELMSEEVEDMFSYSAALIIAMLEAVTHPNMKTTMSEWFNERELGELQKLLTEFKAARSSD